jgi:hypothetical protein
MVRTLTTLLPLPEYVALDESLSMWRAALCARHPNLWVGSARFELLQRHSFFRYGQDPATGGAL